MNRDDFDLVMAGLECLYANNSDDIKKLIPPLQRKMIILFHCGKLAERKSDPDKN
jgi:hypothetical protein